LTSAVERPEAAADADLVRLARAGEARAFEELVRRYASLAVGAALRVTRDPALAEDAAQEAFWKAYRALPRYREESHFGAWLRKIAVHCALDLMRRRRPEVALENGASRLVARHEEKRHDDRSRLEHALGRISPRDREIVLGLSAEGRSVAEMAEELSMTPTTVRVRAHRARKKLVRILTEES
jgi:RNA polymerase sigma-70 factor (ECF subfamily)